MNVLRYDTVYACLTFLYDTIYEYLVDYPSLILHCLSDNQKCARLDSDETTVRRNAIHDTWLQGSMPLLYDGILVVVATSI